MRFHKIAFHCYFNNAGADRGPVLEVVVSRTNFISATTGHKVRVVGLSTALANARDLADWLGITEVQTPEHALVLSQRNILCVFIGNYVFTIMVIMKFLCLLQQYYDDKITV